jgi:hypothetical protein
MVFASGLAGCKKAAEPAAKAYEWQTELVDAEAKADTGSGPVQALLDAAGVLHVVYRSPPTGGGKIKYSQRTGNGWQTELVSGPASGGWSWPESLFLDAAGSPWLLSENSDTCRMILACRQGDRWEDMIGARYGMNPRAVVDSRGYPHLTYWKPGREYLEIDGLWHCWKDETGWRAEAVEDVVVGAEQCLAIAADDSLHVVYSTIGSYVYRYDGPPGEDAVRYAVRRDGVWELSPIADGRAEETEMVLDSLGRPHVAYTLDDKVYYAVLSEGAWVVEELPCPFARVGVGIALTADDQPLVAFVGFGGSSSDSLCLAARVDGQWEVQVIVERLYTFLTRITLSVGPSGAFITYYTPDGFYCAVGK